MRGEREEVCVPYAEIEVNNIHIRVAREYVYVVEVLTNGIICYVGLS